MNSTTTTPQTPSQDQSLVDLIDHLKGVKEVFVDQIALSERLRKEDPFELRSQDPEWAEKSPRYCLVAQFGKTSYMVLEDLNASQVSHLLTLVNYDLSRVEGLSWAALPASFPMGNHFSID